MANEANMETTSVEKVDINLDEIFAGAPGASSITLPEEEVKKPNVFSRGEKVDLAFLDEEVPEKEEVENEDNSSTPEESTDNSVQQETKLKEPSVTADEVDEILNEGLELAEEEDDKSTAKGRRRIEGMSDVFTQMIEKSQFL